MYVLSQKTKGIIKKYRFWVKFIHASVLMSCVCTYFEMHQKNKIEQRLGEHICDKARIVKG